MLWDLARNQFRLLQNNELDISDVHNVDATAMHVWVWFHAA